MRPGTLWGIGIFGVLAVLGVGWVILSDASREPDTPPPASSERSRGHRRKITPEDLAKMPINRSPVERSLLDGISLDADVVTVEAVDEALASREAGIQECLSAARVHGAIPEPLTVTLSLEPEAGERGAAGRLRVGRATTETAAPGLDVCLTSALRSVRFGGTEALEVRATWPPAP